MKIKEFKYQLCLAINEFPCLYIQEYGEEIEEKDNIVLELRKNYIRLSYNGFMSLYADMGDGTLKFQAVIK